MNFSGLFNKTIVIALMMGIISLPGCGDSKETTLQKLKGHWHMKTPYRLTLDISDSTVKVNQYSMLNYPIEVPLFDSLDGSISLPIFCGCGGTAMPIVKDFFFSHDSLVFDNKITSKCLVDAPVKFWKDDPEQCKWTHALENWPDDLELSSFPEQTLPFINLDSLRENNIVAFMALGYPVKKDLWGIMPKIMVRDLFISFTEIDEFINQERQIYGENYPVSLCLIIDTSVPQTFVKGVFTALPENVDVKLYRLATSKEESKLGFEPINNIY